MSSSHVGLVGQNFDFVLSALSTSVTMDTLATMQAGQPAANLDISATAIYNINKDTIKNIFKFSSTTWDISDNYPSGELHYFVHADQWPTNLAFNPSNAMMNFEGSSAIIQVPDPAEMLVKHDFIRYLASKLFNTPKGTDLFSNQSALLGDLNSKGLAAWTDISHNLWKYAATNPTGTATDNLRFLLDPSSNEFCTTDHYTANDNLCRELFQQIVAVQDNRFQTVVLDANNQAPIPFLVGDSISFLYTIYPYANQNTITDVLPFGGRAFKIKLNIVEGTPVNTVPTD